MYYTTELIDKILKSKEAQKIIGWMVPVYGESYVVLWLLEVIGQQLDDMLQWSEEYQGQVVPQTATWALPYWEERYGISTNPNLPVEQRRADVIAKKLARAPINPRKLEKIVSNLTGLDVTITENISKNRFKVTCGGHVPGNIQAVIKKEIDKVKPAHLIYTLSSLQLVYLYQEIGYCAGIRYVTGLGTCGRYVGHMKYAGPCLDMSVVATGKGIWCATSIMSTQGVDTSIGVACKLENSVEASVHKVSLRTTVPVQQNYAAGIHVQITPWYLDGEHSLDGEQRLNAGDYIIEL